MDNYREKVFNDCVHGPIRLHPLCVKIIDTPEFQRLRNIKQMGSTYLVYPGGSHNRFEHSLGVCYLAGRMVEALRVNSGLIYKNICSLTNGYPKKDNGLKLFEITKEEQLCVEIAGLCHDIGHGPYSHLWEQVLADCGVKWKHEEMSHKMFDYLIEKNGLIKDFEGNGLMERERTLIKEFIAGEGQTLSRNKQFLYQIVANKENDIDVDKWDYFLRDGLQLNLKITFDYNRLLQFCCIVKDKRDNYVIGFRSKECNNLWDMFRVRADLHHRAYQHRVVKNLDTMYIDAFVEANKVYKFMVEDELVPLSEAHQHAKVFSYLTDHVIYNILCDPNPSLQLAKDILRRILRREIYSHIGTYNLEVDEMNGDVTPQIIKTKLSSYFQDNHTPEVLRFAVNKSDDKRHALSFKNVVVFDKCPNSWPLTGRMINPLDVSGPYPLIKQDEHKTLYMVYAFCQTFNLNKDKKKLIDDKIKFILSNCEKVLLSPNSFHHYVVD